MNTSERTGPPAAGVSITTDVRPSRGRIGRDLPDEAVCSADDFRREPGVIAHAQVPLGVDGGPARPLAA